MKNLMFIIKFAIVLAIMGWIVKAWAVPKELVQLISPLPVVHEGGCIWRQAEMPCQIFYDQGNDLIYLVFYSADLKEVTFIAAVTNDKKEHILWKNARFST